MTSRMMASRRPAQQRDAGAPGECRLVATGRQFMDKLPQLYDNASLSDVTFVVGQQKRQLHAHRVVLAAMSTRFFNMFNSKHEARYHEKVLPLDNFDPDSFDRMLRYIYGQEITFVGIEPAWKLLEVATHFNVEELVGSAKSYLVMQINPACCCTLWNHAKRVQNADLESRCMHEMATRFEEVAQCPGFLEVEEEGLTQVMQRDDLMCTEEKIFEALLHWVNHRLDEREGAIDQLLPLVRLALIDNLYLQDYVDNNRASLSRCSLPYRDVPSSFSEVRWRRLFPELLRKSKKAVKLVMEAYKYQASPAHRKQMLGSHMSQRSTQRQHLTVASAGGDGGSLQYSMTYPAPAAAAAMASQQQYMPQQQQMLIPSPQQSRMTTASPYQSTPYSAREAPYSAALPSPIPEGQPPPPSVAPSPTVRGAPSVGYTPRGQSSGAYYDSQRGGAPTGGGWSGGGGGGGRGGGDGGGGGYGRTDSALVGPYAASGEGDWR